MKTRLMMIVFSVIALILCGICLGRWAQNQGRAEEARMQNAMSILRSK